MSQRYFTLEEAQAALPQVREIMEEVRTLKQRADAKIGAWRGESQPDPVELAMARGQVEFLLAEANRRLKSLVQIGCVPKDLDLGLVDFPTRLPVHGEAYLCWRLGEDDISHWHGVTEGFSGRKPLPPFVSFLRTVL